jgi:ArsR family transcriptional regulator
MVIDVHRSTPPPAEGRIREMAAVRTLDMTDASPAACCVPIGKPSLSEADAEATASVFKALADPSRVRIVNLLANAGEAVCVCDLTPSLGLSQATVSFHLKKLTAAGLLEREQRGTWAYYSVDREALARVGAVFTTEGGRR